MPAPLTHVAPLVHRAAASLALAVCLIGRTAAATTCVPPTQDWSDFPTGYQCIVGVDHFIANHWGLKFPATGGHPTNGACQALGACMEWVDDLPDGGTWNRHEWGSVPPQAYDVLIFPPHGSNGYGHAAMFDHEEGGAIFVMDDNWDGNMNRSCSWSGHDGWVHSGTWTPYGFYRLKSLEPVTDHPPDGSLDSAACDGIGGWSQDPDDKAAHLAVDLYFDGPAGSGAPALRVGADQMRADLCTPLGSCDHAFSVPPPVSLLDGAPHQVFAYGIDTAAGGPNSLLQGSPRSFACSPPKPPIAPAVKRHIVNPDSLTAWKLSTFTGVARYDQKTSDGIPTGPDETQTPTLVRGDDGSAEIWVLDEGGRRHVADPASMAAWQFDDSKIATLVAVKLYQLKEGPVWPEAPFAFVDPTGAVYLLDVPPTPPATTGTGGAASGGAGGSAGGGAAGKAASGGSPPQLGAAGAKSGGATGAGAAGAPSSVTSGGGTTLEDGAAVPVDQETERGGCAVSVVAPGAGVLGGWTAAATLGLLARRRRRGRRRE